VTVPDRVRHAGRVAAACLAWLLLGGLPACGDAPSGLASAVAAGAGAPDARRARVLNPHVTVAASVPDVPPVPDAPPAAVAPARSDPRVVYWVDPRLPFAALAPWRPIRQVAGPNGLLAEVPEPGIRGAAGDWALLRTADPLDARRAAYRHRIAQGFPMWGETWRSEITANWTDDGTNVTRGVDYWIAWAVKLEPDLVQPGAGEVSLLDFHVVPDPGDTQNNSSFHLFLRDDVLRIVSLWNAEAVTLKSRTRIAQLWSEPAPPVDRWHWFVMKARFHWDAAEGPYLQIWRAVGDGPAVQIAARTGPNAFNDRAPFLPQKFGLYRWDPWTGAPTRTLYSKGFYVLRDLPGVPSLDVHALLALLRSI